MERVSGMDCEGGGMKEVSIGIEGERRDRI
jgi:hypothetical protein